MSGWIKVEKTTASKPEVRAMAKRLGVHRMHVFGCCVAVWQYADSESQEGLIPMLTADDIDEIVGLPGFALAMVDVGWLIIDDAGVTIPRFGAHHGEGAKRALAAERMRRSREKAEEPVAPAPKPPAKPRCADVAQRAQQDRHQTETKTLNTRDREPSAREAREGSPAPGNLFSQGTEPEEDSPSAQREPEIDPESTFEGFWSVVHRKVGKADAERAWIKARAAVAKRVPCSLDEAARWLCGRMETVAATPKGQAGDKSPHPATWLNGGRYDDADSEWQIVEGTGNRGGPDSRGNFAAARGAAALVGSKGAVRFPERSPPRIAQ
jgi:hypothetical protein